MKCYTARYCLAILLSFGLAIVYGLKVAYHIAVVAMVNHTAFAVEGETSKEEVSEDGPFIWTTSMRGIQLSAYFWGYIVGQLPGGRLSEDFSAKWVFFFAVGINVVFALLTPLLAFIDAWAVVFVRIMQGIGGGVSFPATHVLLAQWSPPEERSTMSSISYCGTAAGTVVFTLITGLIAGSLGWQWVYYIEGGLSALWLPVWFIMVADTPQKQHLITNEERDFITESFKHEGGVKEGHPKVPWLSVFKSIPFWAILIAHTCSNWGWYMVLTELPAYMKDVLKFNIKENAVLSSLPYLCMFIFSLILGQLIDFGRRKHWITTTFGRKLATFIASVPPMICFAALCFITEPTGAVVLMTLSIMFIGGMYCGFLSNHIDIASRFAGTLMAITNTVATIPGITVPIFVGWLTEDDASIASWRLVFYVTIALYAVEAIVYLLFASGEEQPFNREGEETS